MAAPSFGGKLRELREAAGLTQTQLAERFDLRAFHDAILSHAAVPLSALRLIMDTRPPLSASG